MMAVNRALDARKEDLERKKELASAQKQATEEARTTRHERQAATRWNQEVRVQLQQQQAQALAATRTTEKAKAAEGGRAIVEVTVDVPVSVQADLPICTCCCSTPMLTLCVGSAAHANSGHTQVGL